jgi:Fe2+ transport system protein B
MIQIDKGTWDALISTAKSKKVYISGNILRLIDDEGSPAYKEYIKKAQAKDAEKQKQRLEVSKAAQEEKKELEEAHNKNTELMERVQAALSKAEEAKEQAEDAREQSDVHRREAEEARILAEKAKATAETDLDFMQKQTQFELMGNIVRVALWVIAGVGITTTMMYATALFGPAASTGDTTLLGNTWSNMFGILLTNSFSIIGTIMGVKYATENRGDSGA